MGVDKKDIKTVVHLEASETAEAYIQEAGRGGRDGSVAKAILIWSLEDSVNYSKFENGSRQSMMKLFAETSDCRRQILLDSLGAEKAVCSGCDLCNEREKLIQLREIKGIKGIFKRFIYQKLKPKSDYEIALQIIKKSKNYYSKSSLSESLFDIMNNFYVKKTGKKNWNHVDGQEVIEQLKKAGLVKEQNLLWNHKLVASKINKKF